MSVVCTDCKTKNRDHAMFCRGCAAKLPGFFATGPAALDIMKSLRPAPAPAPAADARPADAPSQGLLQLESRAFWIRLGLLALAITVGMVGWYAYVTRRVALPVVPAAVAPAAATVAPVRRPSQAPVAPAEALSPGETLAPAGAAARAQLPADVSAPRNGINQREPAARRRDPLATPGSAPINAPVSAPVRAAAADPRPGCAHLNFIAAARCEAAQCRRAEYRIHPHCDAVREQTRRDEARRNLPN